MARRRPRIPWSARPWSRGEATDSLLLPDSVADAMREELPRISAQVVTAIRDEVPSYADPFAGQMGRTIENAVTLALGGFLTVATGAQDESAAATFGEVSDAAFALGRGEARSGRSMDALLSAYRVGARVAWRDLGGAGVRAGLPAPSVARFAELVFDYIDELSAASAAGHTEELARSGRVRQRNLDLLTQSLLVGSGADALVAAAERAEWEPPATLTAVILPESRVRNALGRLDPQTLQPAEVVPGLEEHSELTVLLVPGAGDESRAPLLRSLSGLSAVVGPGRPWLQARSSFVRALRTLQLETLERPVQAEGTAPVDSEVHLPRLVLTGDQEALDDLREQVLRPLRELRPATGEKLQETLRSWLLHQGRRDAVAAELFVHPQTVRYRMQQLREIYGAKLEDPDWVLRLTLALA